MQTRLDEQAIPQGVICHAVIASCMVPAMAVPDRAASIKTFQNVKQDAPPNAQNAQDKI